MKSSILIVLFFIAISLANGARILSVSFVSTKSHKIIYEPLLYALGERGHNVTILGPIKNVNTKNVRNIQTYDPADLPARGVGVGDLFNAKESESLLGNMFSNPFLWFFPLMEGACHINYQLDMIKDLMKEETFDAIIFPPLWNDCIYGLIHKLNTTTILISQMALMPWVATDLGTPTFSAFTPLLYYGQPADMNFFQRTGNFLGIMYFHAVLRFFYFPRMESIYRSYLGQDIPSIREIQKNASLVLVNSHISFNPPRPLLPDIVEVGGMHLRPAKPVPKNLDDFLSGSGPEGFILFSMGSFLQSSGMPEKHRKIFTSVFGKLKQRVIWKWETETMEGKPDNVMLSNWLPQQDVLGHKNIRLFITHGGFGSTTEALYEGVPLVGIPMFSDQASNMKQAEDLGFAVQLRFEQLTEQDLLAAITKVLNDPGYKEKAQKLSGILRDQVDDPLQRACYWVEYVLRHKGATHLRSVARNLNFFEYYSLDVIGFLVVILLGVVSLLVVMMRKIGQKIFGGKSEGGVRVKSSKMKKQ